MIYRPSRELLEESLRDKVEVSTWDNLLTVVEKSVAPYEKPLQLEWIAQGYDKRIESDSYLICVKDRNYGQGRAVGYTHGDPSTLPGYKPCPIIEPTFTPLVNNPNQKYHRGDKVRLHTVGHPMWEGDKVYDMNPSIVGKLATVEYSYCDRFGGEPEKKPSYCLKFEDGNTVSWFHEYQMEPADTETPCTERVPSATQSNTGKVMNEMWKNIENKLMWGKL